LCAFVNIVLSHELCSRIRLQSLWCIRACFHQCSCLISK
jgi:hypothetical protein